MNPNTVTEPDLRGRVAKALEIARKYGAIEGNHHIGMDYRSDDTCIDR